MSRILLKNIEGKTNKKGRILRDRKLTFLMSFVYIYEKKGCYIAASEEGNNWAKGSFV